MHRQSHKLLVQLFRFEFLLEVRLKFFWVDLSQQGRYEPVSVRGGLWLVSTLYSSLVLLPSLVGRRWIRRSDFP